MASVWYCTREDVKSAIDSKETARNSAQLDRLIDAASRSIEQQMRHRKFYPEAATRRFDYPTEYTNPNRRWRVWLDEHELISVTSITSFDTVIPSTDYFLEPVNDGPPYTHVEIDLDSTAYFGHGTTHQREIVIVGTFGYTDDDDPAGALAAAISTTSATTCDVTNSASIGVGSIIKVGSERMIVTGRSMLTSGQTLQTALAANLNNETVVVTTGSSFFVGETILLGAEKMLVEEIAGNNLIVTRAWDGSTLAAHTAPTIYAPRTLTVERNALGTTAATHSSGAAITVHRVPGLIRQLCIAEVITALQQESAAYGRVVGSGDNQREAEGAGLEDLRERAYNAHGRVVF